jgi:hypothetical protein
LGEIHTAVSHTATEIQIFEDIREGLDERHTAIMHTATETQILEDIREALKERHTAVRHTACDRDTVDMKTSGKHWERNTLQ